LERKSKMEKLVMIDHLRKIYGGKRVFLTGHTGFKGSWMLLLLQELGAEVKGLALPPEKEDDLYLKIGGDDLCHSVISDIRFAQRLRTELRQFHPDFVIHMAAQALVLTSYENPVETFRTNVQGTAHLLEALRSAKPPLVAINVTTDKVYENHESLKPYKEDEPLGGYDPYSASKAGSEIVTQSYRRSFFNPKVYDKHQVSLATARSGNVIGGGDYSDNRIIPDLVRAFNDREKLEVRNPEAVRPWQHVLDPLTGYLLLGARMHENPKDFSEAFNFGPDESKPVTVKDLVDIAIDVWGDGTYSTPGNPQPHEAGLLLLDNSKAKTRLGWKPNWDARESIRKTIEWYKNAPGNEREYSQFQIRDYFGVLS
jgi:CDP-glucose 4,6-dehydratase